MNYAITFDTRKLEADFQRIMNVMRSDSIPRVGKTYIEELPKLYAAGKGGDGLTFSDYNADYAKRMGIPVSPKTLKRADGRLYDMIMEGDMLTVRNSTFTGKYGNADTRDIALGQQTGGSGRWGYSNVMFGVNQSLQDQAAQELAHYITERIGE
jgi:hypothetical protein